MTVTEGDVLWRVRWANFDNAYIERIVVAAVTAKTIRAGYRRFDKAPTGIVADTDGRFHATRDAALQAYIQQCHEKITMLAEEIATCERER